MTASLEGRELRSPKVLISVPEFGLQARIEVRKEEKEKCLEEEDCCCKS